MLQAYLPAVVFMLAGAAIGIAFTFANRVLGPRRPSRVKAEAYESGVPSDFRLGRRFPVSYYLVAMMFLLFDVEVILLYPAAVVLGESRYVLAAIAFFIFVLGVALLYEWSRGVLDFDDDEQT